MCRLPYLPNGMRKQWLLFTNLSKWFSHLQRHCRQSILFTLFQGFAKSLPEENSFHMLSKWKMPLKTILGEWRGGRQILSLKHQSLGKIYNSNLLTQVKTDKYLKTPCTPQSPIIIYLSIIDFAKEQPVAAYHKSPGISKEGGVGGTQELAGVSLFEGVKLGTEGGSSVRWTPSLDLTLLCKKESWKHLITTIPRGEFRGSGSLASGWNFVTWCTDLGAL